MKREEILTYTSSSDKETIDLGEKLGRVLEAGDTVALMGELGSGKTWFTKGLALGLGVAPDTLVTSPSFSLLNEYEGRYPVYHIDAYRLENASDFLSTGLEEYFYCGGVVAMEWADRWPEILPEWTCRIRFYIVSDERRKIKFHGDHPRSIYLLSRMKEMAGNPE